MTYVHDRYKTQQTCYNAILENGATLKSIPDCYKNQEMCKNVVDNYCHALEFVPKCFMTQNMCEKSFSIYPSIIKFVPECFMTQEMCDKAVNRCFLYLILFLIDKTEWQSCFWRPFFNSPENIKLKDEDDEGVDDSLAALKLIPKCLLQIKWLKHFILICR